MTRKTFEAARDCILKIKDVTPDEAKIKEMLSFLSAMDRLSEICSWEGPSGIRLEADHLPENTFYEKIFKESVQMWLDGAGVDEASDHAADRYFEADPAGYDAAICFAAVYSAASLLKDELAYSFIDDGLQYLLPDGWRWVEEYKKEEDAREDGGDRNFSERANRGFYLGRHEEETEHRFDDIIISELLPVKDPASEEIGKRIAERLPDYKNGALQLILKELTYQDLEKALYALPKEAEERIMSNLGPKCIRIIKGDCILNKDTVSLPDIRASLRMLEEAIDAYDGDPALEAEYDG